MSKWNWNTGRKASLLGSTSGAVLLAGMTVMTPQQARAACPVSGSGFLNVNQTMNCTGVGVNGGTFSATNNAAVNIQNGATVITGIKATAGPAGTFTFKMNDGGSSIIGNGTMVEATTTLGNQNWTINGTIESKDGKAIVSNAGTTGNVNMTINSDGHVKAVGDAITIKRAAGLGDLTLTNHGEVLGGTASGSNGVLLQNTGAGSMLVNNDGTIGNSGHVIGGTAVSLTGTGLGNGTVKNSGNGSIYSAGDAVKIAINGAGNAVVENTGNAAIHSTAGQGVNLSTGAGEATVRNSSTKGIYGATTGVNILTGAGTAKVENSGSITGGHTGVQAVAVLGNVVIGGKDDGSGMNYGSVEGTDGPGILGAAGGSVTIDAGDVKAGAGVSDLAGLVPGVDLGAILGAAAGVDLTGVGLGGGVIGIAVSGDATVNLHGTVEVASGGTFGGAAISAGAGDATVSLKDNAKIDPPLIGEFALALGSGNAIVNVGDSSTVEADLVGLMGVSLGAGHVLVEVGDNSQIGVAGGTIPLVGIATLDVSGPASTDILLGTGSTVRGSVTAIAAVATDTGSSINIENVGSDIIGGGIAPVIITYSDSGNTISNGGTIRGESSNPATIAVASVGGNLELNNTGDVIGSVIAYTTGDDDANIIDNRTGGNWTTSGFSLLSTEGSGDNRIQNATGATIDVSGNAIVAMVADEGDNSIANDGQFNVNAGQPASLANTSLFAQYSESGNNTLSNNAAMSLGGITNFVQVTEQGNNTVENNLQGVINATGLTTFTLGTGEGLNRVVNAGEIDAGDLAFTLVNGGGDNEISNTYQLKATGSAAFTLATEAGDNTLENTDLIDIGGAAVATLISGEGDNLIANSRGAEFKTGDSAVFTLASGKGDNAIVNLDATFDFGDQAVFTLLTAEGDNAVVNALGSKFTVGDNSVFTLATGKGDNVVLNLDGEFGTGANAVFTLLTAEGDNVVANVVESSLSAGANSVFTLATGKGDNVIANAVNSKFSAGENAVFTLLTAEGDNVIANVDRSTVTVGENAVFSLLTGAGNNQISNVGEANFNVGANSVFTLATGAGNNTVENADDSTFTTGENAVFTLATADGNNAVTNGSDNTFTVGDNAAISMGTLKGDNEFSNAGTFDVVGAAMFNLGSVSGSNFVKNSGGFTTDGPTLFNLATAGDGHNTLSNSGEFTVAGPTMFNFAALGGNNLLENSESFTATGLTLFNMAASGDNTVENEGDFSVAGLTSFNFAGNWSAFNNRSDATFEALGVTTFLGIDAFNNEGELTMVNGWSDYGFVTMPGTESGVGDWVFIDGNFVAGPDSTLAIDARLSVKGDSSADVLSIAGDVSGGTTKVDVNYNPAVVAGYNPDGITVARVWSGNTQPGDFQLANGPIDRGLFTYDLFLDPGTSGSGMSTLAVEAPDMGGATWVLASYADSSAYALSAFAGLSQGVWNTTSDSWIDRAGDLRVGAEGSPDPTKKSGIWGRMIGSGAERSTETTMTPFQNQSVKIDTGYDQTLWGFQAGIDHEFEGTVADGVLIAGVLGGYVTSKADFNNGDSVTFAGPQVGVYASWIKGGLYVDGLVKGDFLKADYNVAGADADTDSTTIGARIETGYRFLTATGMFIEPNASLAYAHTKIDDINLSGTPVNFDNGNGLEGKLGARFGGSSLKDGVKYDPYVSVGLVGELLSQNTVFLDSGPGLLIEDDAPDVFGEVGVGINIFSSKSGWTGFAKADLRVGDDYFGGTGKIGATWAW